MPLQKWWCCWRRPFTFSNFPFQFEGCTYKMGPVLAIKWRKYLSNLYKWPKTHGFQLVDWFSLYKVEVFHPTVLISLFFRAHFDSLTKPETSRKNMELAKLIAPSGPWGKATKMPKKHGGSRGLVENQVSKPKQGSKGVSVEMYFFKSVVTVIKSFCC